MVILLAVINSEINDSNNYKIAKYIIENIDQYDHVSAFGYLQSENVALNLQYDLQTSRKVIYTCMQYANQIEYIKQADESHPYPLIAISSIICFYYNQYLLKNIE